MLAGWAKAFWVWGTTPMRKSTPLLVSAVTIKEAAVEIRDLVPLYSLVLSPGACSETCNIFLGRIDSGGIGGVHGLATEHEDILVKTMPFADALALLARDEIDNSAAVIALQWLALHRDELRNRWR